MQVAKDSGEFNLPEQDYGKGKQAMTRKQSKSAMWGRTFLTVCALVLSASLSYAAPHHMSNGPDGPRKMARELEGKTNGRVDVIVRFTRTPTAFHHRKVTNRVACLSSTSLRRSGDHSGMSASTKSASASTQCSRRRSPLKGSPNTPDCQGLAL